MHNLHLVTIKADSGEEACEAVDSRIEDWGDENNWRTICGCISEHNEVYFHDENGRWRLDNTSTINALNALATQWLKPDVLINPKRAKAAMKRLANKQNITGKSWYSLAEYATHMHRVDGRKKLNVLEDSFKSWDYDENGITQLDGQGDRLWVVLVDMHS